MKNKKAEKIQFLRLYKKYLKEIRNNSEDKLKKIYTNDFIKAGIIVEKPDKFINHHTIKGAERILNVLNQNENLKDKLIKNFEIVFCDYIKKYKIK